MVGAVIQALIAFLLTGVIGTYLAHRWQARSAKETRFFEASRDMYNQMVQAADKLSDLAGRRLYAMQRLCLLGRSHPAFDEASCQHAAIVKEWNEKLLSLELDIRTKFRHSSLAHFEQLQSDLSATTSKLDKFIAGHWHDSGELLHQIRLRRADFFNFAQQMIVEARLLHRQMHFGVIVKYERGQVRKLSTKDLVQVLISSRVEGEAVVRAPSDFGLPVQLSDARFGIHE